MSKNNIWFIGDTHFYHTNIIKYCNRPFSYVEQMNECIIECWNERIQPNDFVYHLGDFAFCSLSEAIAIRKRLNGKIFLIKGNHDKVLLKRSEFRALFEWVKDYYMLKVPDAEMGTVQKIVLFHYPIVSWDSAYHGSWNVHGHCHLTIPDADKRIDVGVDRPGGKFGIPWSYEEIKEKFTIAALEKAKGEATNASSQ